MHTDYIPWLTQKHPQTLSHPAPPTIWCKAMVRSAVQFDPVSTSAQRGRGRAALTQQVKNRLSVGGINAGVHRGRILDFCSSIVMPLAPTGKGNVLKRGQYEGQCRQYSILASLRLSVDAKEWGRSLGLVIQGVLFRM